MSDIENPSNPTKILIRTHYGLDDPQFMGDYYAVELFFDDDPIPVLSYGDYYHDKGKEKVEGIVDLLKYLSGNTIEITKENVADYEL